MPIQLPLQHNLHSLPDEAVRRRIRLLPLYKVILHNDNVHEMVYVIFALHHSINNLSLSEAEHIMLAAHLTGTAIVVICPKELAEYYQERLLSYHLTATIEPE